MSGLNAMAETLRRLRLVSGAGTSEEIASARVTPDSVQRLPALLFVVV